MMVAENLSGRLTPELTETLRETVGPHRVVLLPTNTDTARWLQGSYCSGGSKVCGQPAQARVDATSIETDGVAEWTVSTEFHACMDCLPDLLEDLADRYTEIIAVTIVDPAQGQS